MKQLTMVGTLCAAMAGLLSSGNAQAILVDRGGGMLYDSVLNITWLQDANYASTSGYCNITSNCWTGFEFGEPVNMPSGNMTWQQANALASSLTVGGYTDWRLARMSELSFMFFANLGWTNIYPYGTRETGLVTNLGDGVYWSDGACSGSYGPSCRPYFDFAHGASWQQGDFWPGYAWAVHDGDIAAVPVPGSVALLAGGLALLGVVTRRRERLAVEK
ncbi:MAG: hypothetical protein WCJ87_08135 [Burkholderiales bacterium]